MLIHVLYVMRVISLRPQLHLIYQSTQSIFSLSIGSGNQQIDPYVCAGPLPYQVNYTGASVAVDILLVVIFLKLKECFQRKY